MFENWYGFALIFDIDQEICYIIRNTSISDSLFMTPESPVINKFLQLLDEVINNSLTDLHVSVGNFPYIRTPNRDVEPVESFGILSNNDVLRIIDFTGSINTQELEETLEGMNYIYEFK